MTTGPTAGPTARTPTTRPTPAPALTPPAGPPAELCPRCASGRTVSYGARVGCCVCGATWQATR